MIHHMPEKNQKAQYLGTKKFSNRDYSIRIDFYDHAMAYADLRDKRKWRRKRRKSWRSLLFFDACTSESMYDYFDCLNYLGNNKVAQRWFARELRHCTDGLLYPDGRQDYEKVYARMYRNFHESTNRFNYCFKDNRQPLPAGQLKILLDMLPDAAFDEKIDTTYVGEGEHTIVRMSSRWATKTIGKPKGFKLELIRKVLPEFYETIKQERTLDNCTINIEITWMSPTDCDLFVRVQDNDYVVYEIP